MEKPSNERCEECRSTTKTLSGRLVHKPYCSKDKAMVVHPNHLAAIYGVPAVHQGDVACSLCARPS